MRLKLQCPKSLLLSLFLLLTAIEVHAQGSLTLHYDKPAANWNEALPIGNGRLGAMVFGNPENEQLQLNEATLWSGGPVDKAINPQAFDFLEPAREALKAGDYDKASDLVKNMQGRYTQSYVTLGDLRIGQDLGGKPTSNYYRDLNIQDAISTTRFTANGVEYTREVFASAPADAIIMRIRASKPHQISLSATAKSPLKSSNSAATDFLSLKGRAPTHVDPTNVKYTKEPIIFDDSNSCKGMRFELAVKPIVKDGNLKITDDDIVIKDATEVLLVISAATSFNGFDKCPYSQGKNEHKLLLSHLKKSDKKPYEKLFDEHKRDYQQFFNRVSLQFNSQEESKSRLPTNKRLEDYAQAKSDSELEALYFQFGRYLLISSSRTPNAPANLQGIWNKEVRPTWSSNYTTNINVQMNYWPVESANLSELFSPLNDLIKSLSVTGRETAASYYHAKGWTLHHNSDIWASTNPVGDLGKGNPMWANWYMGSGWISRHLWDHYQFTSDKQYLKSVYPIMKSAAEFTLSWLQKNDDGLWVTMPSTSPENVFYFGDKKQGHMTIASTMDMGIIRDLFTNVIAASEVLDTDKKFREKIIATKVQLFPFKIGSKGQLQEWYKDYEDVDPYHRHTSHLYALHPAIEISPLTTPDLAQAAKRTLEMRGDDGTGWALAWKVNMWARLLDGDHSYILFRNLLRLSKGKQGGVYPNLFDAHPPFQIDGNFAGTAGAIEMLLQSQNNELHLLPALPAAWKDGKVTGLVARGNFVVDISWDKNQLTTASITARKGGVCRLRTNTPIEISALNLRSEKSNLGYTLTFTAEKGKNYSLKAI